MPLHQGLSKRAPASDPRHPPGARYARNLRCLAILLLLVVLILSPGCFGKKSSSPAQTLASATSGSQAQRESEPHFRFIVCGDPQNNYQVFDRILEAAKSVDFLVIAGDLTGSGTPTEFKNFLSKMKESGVRYYGVPGNHDVASGPVDDVYESYMGPPRQAFDYQNCHFVLIDNSTPSLGFYPEEQQWVKGDLEAAKANGFEHIFAVCHTPPGFPYSSHYDPEERIGMDANESLLPVLSAGKVEELFCGHVHVYEQSREDGMLITVTGGAGAPLHLSPQNGGYHHYVLVKIDGRRRSQQVVKVQ